ISLQQRGVQAFMDSEVEKKLKLTGEQKDKLKTIQEDATKEMREIFQNAGADRAAAMEKIRTLRKESLDKASGVLTDEQKKTWKDMTGEPFEVRFERRQGAQ